MRELVNVLTGVSAVWDTEAEVEIKTLQQVIAEIVSLYHAEVVQGSVSNCEFHPVGIKETEESLRGCNHSQTVA